MIGKKTIEELAHKALEGGNPYMNRVIRYQIGGEDRYFFKGADGSDYTREQIDEEYLKTARHDIELGYKDRSVGYYDKWYRYNHADEGRAYDLGVRYATTENKCPCEFHIIECTA